MNFLNNIDLNGNQLQNAVIHPLGTPPSGAKEGQIYFDSTSGDKKLYFYNGTEWVAIQDTNNYVDGLSFSSASGLLTLGRNGALADLTVNLDGRYLTAHPSVSAASSVDNSGRTYIQDITLDSFGHIISITSATETVTDTNTLYTVSVGAGGTNSATIVLSGSDSSSDSVTISGTANEIQVTEVGDQINIGLPDDVNITNNLVIGGNLTVNGSVTTVNTETILLADNILTLNSNETGSPTQNAGIEVERGTSPNVGIIWNESTGKWTATEDGTNYLNILTTANAGGYVASIGDGINVNFALSHGLNSRDVRVELFDNSSYDTVYADVVRTSTSQVTISFTNPPTTNDIRVLISKVG